MSELNELNKLNSLNRIDRIILLSLSLSSISFFFSISYFILFNSGANLNPNSDNTRVNPYGSNNNHGNNYSPGSYPPSNSYGSHPVDPNQIFGNPNRQPQANQPWSGLPVFQPNPTSGQASPQQPIYPIPQQNYYPYPQPNINIPGGLNPHTDIFGHPPPGAVPQYVYPPPRATTRTPGILEQFLASGRRRNFGISMHTATSWQHLSFIVILSVCNVFVGRILTARH